MTAKLLNLLKLLWIVLAMIGLTHLAWADNGKAPQASSLNAITLDHFAHIWSDQKWFQLEFNKQGEALYRDHKILLKNNAVLSGDTAYTNLEILVLMLAEGGFLSESCDMADISTNGSIGCWCGYNYADWTGLSPKRLIAAIVNKPKVDECFHRHFGYLIFSEERFIRDVILNQLVYGGELRFENLWIKRDLTVYGSLRGQPLSCRSLKMNGYGVVYKLLARDIHVEGYFATRQAKIRQNAYIAGRLEAHNLEVGRDLRVIGSASLTRAKLRSGHISLTGAFPIKFTDVNVKSDLTFDRESYCHKPLVAVIDGKSTINGSIIFKTPGKLLLGSGVKIKGKIHNAAIQRYKEERLDNL